MKTSLLLATAVLAGSCVHTPPKLMVADRTWIPTRTGYVFGAGYYTAREVRDPADGSR